MIVIKTYPISQETLSKVVAALRDHWFSNEGSTNNDSVIEATELLEGELKEQGWNK
jgi:hypothetical protein